MKISLDLDGTVWSHMAFFRSFMLAMMETGNEVGILTAHRDVHRDADLLILAGRKFPRPDFFICRRYDSRQTYAEFKAAAIIEHAIDLHFDDMNFGSAEVEATMRALLGDQQYRLVKVTPRFPEAVCYE